MTIMLQKTNKTPLLVYSVKHFTICVVIRTMPLNHHKGRPEKVGMTTKKSQEKEAKEKKRRTIISNNGREREKNINFQKRQAGTEVKVAQVKTLRNYYGHLCYI